MAQDLYAILGVDRNATAAEIKKKYKQLAITLHPDKQAGKTEAEKKEAETKFKEVAAAYEVLGDEQKRQQYDMYGTVNMNGSSGNTGGFNWNDFDLNDILGGMFGGRTGGYSRTYNTPPGNDVRMQIPLTIEEIYNGCTKKVKYKRQVRCASCHGDGGSGKKTCSVCGGTGQIMKTQMSPFGYQQQITTCHHCKGTGYTVDKKCNTCNGTGFTMKEETLEVKFPAGIQNGNGIQYQNKGSESKSPKGNNGSFVAIAVYKVDSDKYVIEGFDVLEIVDIPYYDVLLGCEYKLMLPNGEVRKLNIESCTPNSKRIRLYNDGINHQGDYYVEIRYKFPDKLTEKERELIEQLKVNAVVTK